MPEIKLTPKETYHLCLKLDGFHALGACPTCISIREKIVNLCSPLIIIGHTPGAGISRQRCNKCGRFIETDSSCFHCQGKEQA